MISPSRRSRRMIYAAPWKGRGFYLGASLLFLYLICGAFVVPDFLMPFNLISILYSTAVLLPAVLGMQSLVILGRFDLSIGAVASVVGMSIGLALVWSHSIIISLAVGTIVGIVAGCINAFLVAHRAIDPLIATLATMGIMRSISLASNGGRIVSGFPQEFARLANVSVRGISLLVLAALMLLLLTEFAFRHLTLFRRFYAVGGNAVAANHSGVKVTNIVTLGYLMSAIGAAITGTVQASRTLSASPLVFQGLALEAITACLIGGSRLSGGRGTMFGAALGLLVVVATRNIVVLLGIPVYWMEFSIGLLLLLSVSIDFRFLKKYLQSEGKD